MVVHQVQKWKTLAEMVVHQLQKWEAYWLLVVYPYQWLLHCGSLFGGSCLRIGQQQKLIIKFLYTFV